MDRLTIQEMVEEARSHLARLEPAQARDAAERGALLVDVRSQDQRLQHGTIPDSIHVPLSVLEWRLDPDSEHRLEAIRGLDDHIILICAQGYSSSLAARRLQELGFGKATDVVGGFESWRSQGLPIED